MTRRALIIIAAAATVVIAAGVLSIVVTHTILGRRVGSRQSAGTIARGPNVLR